MSEDVEPADCEKCGELQFLKENGFVCVNERWEEKGKRR